MTIARFSSEFIHFHRVCSAELMMGFVLSDTDGQEADALFGPSTGALTSRGGIAPHARTIEPSSTTPGITTDETRRSCPHPRRHAPCTT